MAAATPSSEKLDGGSAVDACSQFIVVDVILVVEIDLDSGSPVMVSGEMVVGS
jgi:hypothetical protein